MFLFDGQYFIPLSLEQKEMVVPGSSRPEICMNPHYIFSRKNSGGV